MNKKLTLFTLAGLALAGITEISAASWKVKNSLGRDICVTINTGLTRIRRHIPNGQEALFKSKLCLYSVSVKEGTDPKTGSSNAVGKRCIAGIPNIAKMTVKDILGYNMEILMKKGATVYAADDKAKEAMAILKVEAQKSKKLCKNMNFEVVSEDGKPKIQLLGIKKEQKPQIPTGPIPAPQISEETRILIEKEQQQSATPPAPPVMEQKPQLPETGLQAPPAPPVMEEKPESKTPMKTQKPSLLEEIRAGRELKPVGEAERKEIEQRRQEARKTEQQKALESGLEKMRIPEGEETEEIEGVWGEADNN